MPVLARRHTGMRHLPPTAVAVKWADLMAGLSAIRDPEANLNRFRSGLSASIGNPNIFLVSSGRAALTLILLAFKRHSDHTQVIVPAYSCPTVVRSVMEAGLKPIFCDVSPQTLALDQRALDQLLELDILAVIPTHLYGLAQDVTEIINLGKKHGFFVIEDAAQSFSAKIYGRAAGTRGDAGFFSLGRGKCLPAGQGGVIVASDPSSAWIDELFGETPAAHPETGSRALLEFIGYAALTRPAGWWFVVRSPMNPAHDGMEVSPLPEIRLAGLSGVVAGIGASMLARMEQINATRRRNARRWMEILAGFDFVKLPELPVGAEPVYLRLPVVLDCQQTANRLFELLHKENIGVSKSYTRTLPDLFSAQVSVKDQHFPGATRLADCLLTLPTHDFITEQDFDRASQIFKLVEQTVR